MAKAYVCDACGITMTDPYEAKMKEFYVAGVPDYGTIVPSDTKIKKKVHLCDECYHALHEIAKGVSG